MFTDDPLWSWFSAGIVPFTVVLLPAAFGLLHQWAPGVRSGTTWLVVECGLPPHFTALVERKKEMTMQETISAGDAGFEEPVIRFEEPEVKEAGDLKTVTKGFFGSFSP